MKHGRETCHLVPGSLYQGRQKQDQHVAESIKYVRSQPFLALRWQRA